MKGRWNLHSPVEGCTMATEDAVNVEGKDVYSRLLCATQWLTFLWAALFPPAKSKAGV